MCGSALLLSYRDHTEEVLDIQKKKMLEAEKMPLDALAGSTLFSTPDLASGHNQVPVVEHVKAKTAFCTPFGLFEFNGMPCVFCNTPTHSSTFQHLMESIFKDDRFRSLLLYYKIVMFSTSFESHLQGLEVVLGNNTWLT